MKKISIREMTKADIDEVLEIEEASFPTPWSGESFAREIDNPCSFCHVALAGDVLIGYACASRILDEGHILNLAVRPDYRGRGIGKLLALSVLAKLVSSGCREVFLEVRTSNRTARRLYESLGFRMVGLRKGYYPLPREDAIIMKKELGRKASPSEADVGI